MKELYEDLHEVCEMASSELGEMVDKVRNSGGKMNNADLEAVDKLTHTLKSVKTTMAMMDAEGDSGRYDPNRTYNDGYGSYARRRDSMGRYSRRAYDDMR